MKTYVAKEKDIVRKWYLIDAKGKILGRIATRAATILRGKDNPIFTPHVDTGNGVIVINASQVAVTGNKLEDKVYTRYSGYPGGLKKRKLIDVLEKRPEEVIMHAVKGMLPKNALGRDIIKKLKVYPGAEHPHVAQKPEVVELKDK